jgi:hypothetical protein
MALSNMVAENASQSSVASANSGFPKYEEADPEGSRLKIEIALRNDHTYRFCQQLKNFEMHFARIWKFTGVKKKLDMH